ncbi:DALR anticodon-binding domain-containing protein 3 isoform X2 [Drosophila busckii]|nr:DALR anticodon-binding domain-containing protein 3 isoform X2 [Drosophila busckii]
MAAALPAEPAPAMSHNPITELTCQLIHYFARFQDRAEEEREHVYTRYGELLHYHNESIVQFGDLSIAASRINWACFCQRRGLQLRHLDQQMIPDEEAVQLILEKSKEWIFPLASVTKLRKERYALRFQRAPIVAHVIGNIMQLGELYGKPQKLEFAPDTTVSLVLHEQFLDVEAPPGNSKEMHKFRARQLFMIVSRLLKYTNMHPVEPEDQTDETLVISIDSNNHARRPTQPDIVDGDPGNPVRQEVRLVCGPVVESHKKAATTLDSLSYMNIRSNDMLLIAMHRHGVRDCPQGEGFQDLMRRLGFAAVIVDLFEVRHSSCASLVSNGLGSSKGANYILYNSARLETLLRTFNGKVETGVYGPLPPLESVDLSTLEEDLDWHLIYGYLLHFPEMIESVLLQFREGHVGVHILVRYIVGLASTFSRYYRNKQILVQHRANLMPVLHARVYLVKAVRQVLNLSLALLGIEPVNYM